MPLRWVKAHIQWLPRYEAVEALQMAQIISLPHLATNKQGKSRDREQWFARMQQQARGLSADRQYDAHGRLVTNTGRSVRAWMNAHFAEARLPTLQA